MTLKSHTVHFAIFFHVTFVHVSSSLNSRHVAVVETKGEPPLCLPSLVQCPHPASSRQVEYQWSSPQPLSFSNNLKERTLPMKSLRAEVQTKRGSDTRVSQDFLKCGSDFVGDGSEIETKQNSFLLHGIHRIMFYSKSLSS